MIKRFLSYFYRMEKELKERLDKETIDKGKISKNDFDKLCKEYLNSDGLNVYNASWSMSKGIALFNGVKFIDGKAVAVEKPWRFKIK